MIVVDCSAVVDALTGLPEADELRRLLADEELHAPSLIDVEIVSALHGLTRRRDLSPGRARDVLTDFDDLPLRRWDCVDTLRRRAFELRDNISAHDATYVALAETLECRLVTRDRRLARTRGHRAAVTLV